MSIGDLGGGFGFDFTNIPTPPSDYVSAPIDIPSVPYYLGGTDLTGVNLPGVQEPIGAGTTGDMTQPFFPASAVPPGAQNPTTPPPNGLTMGDVAGAGKTALPFIQAGIQGVGAGLGIEQLGIAKKAQQAQLNALKTEQQASKPAAAAAGQLIPAGTQAVLGGQLPPGLEAKAQSYEQNLRAQVKQMAAQLGIDVNTAMAQFESMIQQQVAQYRQALAQSVLTAGQGVANTAVAGGSVSGAQARGMGGDITTVMTDANNALSKMLAGSS